MFNGAAATNYVAARTRNSAGSNGDAISTVGIASADYYVVTGLWVSAAERYVWLNGVGVGSNTDSRIVTGLDTLTIGRLDGASPSLYMSGQVADVAIWSGLPSGGFTSAEVSQLGQLNVSPLLVRPDELVFYAPLPGVVPTTPIDVIGSYDLILVGGPVSGNDAPPTEHFHTPYAVPPPIGYIATYPSNALTAEQTVGTNIHGGYASSSQESAQAVATNVIQVSALTSQSVTQEVLDNTIQVEAASASFILDVAGNNVLQESVSLVEPVSQVLTNNVTQVDVISIQATTQLATPNIIEVSAASALTAVGNAGLIQNLTAFSNVSVLQVAKTNFVSYPPIPHIVTATQGLTLNVERSLELETICFVDSKAYRTIEASASTTATANQELGKGADASTTQVVESEASANTTNYAASIATVTSAVSVNIERNLAASSTVTTTGIASVFETLTNCNLHKYAPQGPGTLPTVVLGTRTTITLECGSETLELRNPEFNNSDELQIVRALNRTRNGEVLTYRDSNWPKSQIKSFSVVNLKRSEALALLAFQYDCLGQEVVYTDMENRSWVGAIINPQESIVANRPDSYSVNFQFRGVLETEKTW
jgi:hypothetical protein